MSLRSTLTRLAITTAAGALITSVAVTPALADDDWGGGDGGDPGFSQGGQGDQEGQGGQGGQEGQGGQGGQEGQQGDWNQGDDHHDDQRLSRGVVTASELLLRSAPNRGSQVIRVAHRGERVSIFCRTNGQSVDGNRQWYLLTDGTWAWGSARFIDTIGTPPRWC
ncbi:MULTISPECIES: SH3 domain-containing protein [unclassified Streptomyces]|uniref:SH3 domain-containing protein n=1 Tax=unclassified Streptomyces TaxID=2593676 RepID=UPI00224CF0CB|nr:MULTISPECIES: SH3 domain-containing protein [unclassified Streptomyces]MCX5061381.1 SH3 domain-containing protein [Streptomyces sp. NBC_00452]MCX5292991.1 SH3 domain-containing protein [Streptomyces sp. NBC_00183]